MIKEKKKKYDCKNFVLTLFCLFLLFFSPMITNFSAFANETIYTTVLEDLSKDENFNAENYPVLTDDYSLDVIQIAESIDKKLFVYVYSPSTLQATSINLSKTIGVDITPNNYTLTLISQNNALHKYLVNDFKVENTLEHYYSVVSIFRAWNEEFDELPADGQTISEISYSVGAEWTFLYTADGLQVSCLDTDFITIENKYVGFVRYDAENAPTHILSPDYDFDSHFVAFKTDKKIDNLLEASLSYSTQSVRKSTTTTFGEIQRNIVADISCQDKQLHTGSSFWGWLYGNNTYEYYSIQTIDSFLEYNNDLTNIYNNPVFSVSNVSNLTEDGKRELGEMEWVLNFVVTEHNTGFTYGGGSLGVGGIGTPIAYTNYTIVGDVTLLRLKFDMDGEIYNLGVIDNKQSGDGVPDNITITKYTLADWVKLLIAIVVIVVAVIVLWPFMPTILSLLWKGIKLLFKGLYYILKYIAIGVYYILASPFMLIKNL